MPTCDCADYKRLAPDLADPTLDQVISDGGKTRREAMLSNAIADAVTRHYGWAPISTRYGAADAAIAVLRADTRLTGREDKP